MEVGKSKDVNEIGERMQREPDMRFANLNDDIVLKKGELDGEAAILQKKFQSNRNDTQADVFSLACATLLSTYDYIEKVRNSNQSTIKALDHLLQTERSRSEQVDEQLRIVDARLQQIGFKNQTRETFFKEMELNRLKLKAQKAQEKEEKRKERIEKERMEMEAKKERKARAKAEREKEIADRKWSNLGLPATRATRRAAKKKIQRSQLQPQSPFVQSRVDYPSKANRMSSTSEFTLPSMPNWNEMKQASSQNSMMFFQQKSFKPEHYELVEHLRVSKEMPAEIQKVVEVVKEQEEQKKRQMEQDMDNLQCRLMDVRFLESLLES